MRFGAGYSSFPGVKQVPYLFSGPEQSIKMGLLLDGSVFQTVAAGFPCPRKGSSGTLVHMLIGFLGDGPVVAYGQSVNAFPTALVSSRWRDGVDIVMKSKELT